jgi:hypothetical protein
MKFSFLILFFAFSVSAAFSQTPTPPDSDFQFWHETQLNFPLVTGKDSKGKNVDRVSFFLSGALRVGRNYRRPVDERVGFGFDFRVNKFLTLTPAYLYRAGQPYLNRKEFESRFRMAATLGKSWTKFSVRNRNLLEYRLRNSRSDSVRYRNRTQLSVPVRKNDREIVAPFVSNEVFYEIRDNVWTRNELILGISRKLNANASADFFYLYQRNRDRILRNLNALGVNLKFTIR